VEEAIEYLEKLQMNTYIITCKAVWKEYPHATGAIIIADSDEEALAKYFANTQVLLLGHYKALQVNPSFLLK